MVPHIDDEEHAIQQALSKPAVLRVRYQTDFLVVLFDKLTVLGSVFPGGGSVS